MNVYTTDKIRNVCLLGHGGSGKTSLVEAMAYLSGITSTNILKIDEITSVTPEKPPVKALFHIFQLLIVVNDFSVIFVDINFSALYFAV